MRKAAILAGALLAALAGGARADDWPATVAGVATLPPAGEIRHLSQPALLPEAQAAWDASFAGQAYFGAFAISKGGGSGHVTGANSLGAAHDIALQECESRNGECRVVAELVPAGWKRLPPGQVVLTPETAANYASMPTRPAFRAMAVSADGAYSLSYEHKTQAEADAAALSDCESFRHADLAYPCHLMPWR